MTAIVCVSQSWGIGRDGALLFRISADHKRFRALTVGKTVILGHKTLDTFPGGKPLNVVEKDGNKVLQKMLAVRPQVVLLDAFMPGLDALAVKQRYNAAGERHTSFFVTGAFQSEEMV